MHYVLLTFPTHVFTFVHDLDASLSPASGRSGGHKQELERRLVILELAIASIQLDLLHVSRGEKIIHRRERPSMFTRCA